MTALQKTISLSRILTSPAVGLVLRFASVKPICLPASSRSARAKVKCQILPLVADCLQHGWYKYNCSTPENRHFSSSDTGGLENIPSKMSKLTLVSSNKIFGGEQRVYSHESSEVGCTMKFGVFLPAEALAGSKLPVVVWLSGLTCTEQNFITKAGAQRVAADLKLIIVNPDTSPRGLNIEGEDDSYDFGSGAGFYVDATTDKWKKNYRMYSYMTKEFLSLVHDNFPTIPEKQSIFGHSMGGHGALILAMKNPGLFCSVSAFAPISHPMECPWGQKCFGGYLGNDKEAWKAYDASVLVRSYNGPPLNILVDQGAADNFLKEKQLLPEQLVEACKESNVPIVLRMKEGYDHSYYFMASFMEDHLKHHAQFLHQ